MLGIKGTSFRLIQIPSLRWFDSTDGITKPAEHLEFFWDPETGLASVYGRDEKGQTVERIFDFNGLGGRKELISERSRYVKTLLVCLKFAQTGNAEALALLKEACQSDAPYRAFALKYIAP